MAGEKLASSRTLNFLSLLLPLNIGRWTLEVGRSSPAPAVARQHERAFTLIELLVVVSIIIILGGLAFPAIQGVLDRAKKTQAKNDLIQIVTAVNAFYTEYGRYPVLSTISTNGTYDSSNNNGLLTVLRGTATAGEEADLNPRRIAFITPPLAKDANTPRAGLGQSDGKYYDPWGSPYCIRLDDNYDNVLPNPYAADKGAGPANLNGTAIGWSLGKNGALGGGAPADSKFGKEPGSRNEYAASGDVISWQ